MKPIAKLVAPGHEMPSILAEMAKHKSKKSKPTQAEAPNDDTWTLRPNDEIRELVRQGMLATGSKRQTLIFRVLREKLKEIVADERAKREAAERFFFDPEAGNKQT